MMCQVVSATYVCESVCVRVTRPCVTLTLLYKQQLCQGMFDHIPVMMLCQVVTVA